MSEINWIPVIELPKKSGSYAIALNPHNYEEMSNEDINIWRQHVGFRIAWYDADTFHKWFIHEPGNSKVLNARVTHWSTVPSVPEV